MVMAAGGYPGAYEKGLPIDGLEAAAAIEDLTVFHAGTTEKDGRVVTAGGRVLGVTGLGSTVAEAIDKAYRGVKAISWPEVHYRSDIGRKALDR
ncbi:MAG: phosphoribosylglycinamide synthetase C domain-containing protein [Syntrophotaleaceae bacterium]